MAQPKDRHLCKAELLRGTTEEVCSTKYKKHVSKYFSDTHPDFPFISWCTRSRDKPCTSPRRLPQRCSSRVKRGAPAGGSEHKCCLTGNMHRGNLRRSFTSPVSQNQLKHPSQTVQAHHGFYLFFFFGFVFLKVRWHLRGCYVVLSSRPCFHFSHEWDRSLVKT